MVAVIELLPILALAGFGVVLSSTAGASEAPPASSDVPHQGGGGAGPRSALDIARGELGAHEEPDGSNTGPRVLVYLAGCMRRGKLLGLKAAPWCAAFASWCLASAGVTVLGYRAAVSELVTDARAAGRWHDEGDGYNPKPGDLAIFRRGGKDPRLGEDGHVAIVESVFGVDSFTTIGGNEGNAVRRTPRHRAGNQPGGELVGWVEL